MLTSETSDSVMNENADSTSKRPGIHFINFQSADDFKNPSKKRAAKSHAQKRAHRERRDKLSQHMSHFKNTSIQEMTERLADSCQAGPLTDPAAGISVKKLDPFESLIANASRLHWLLRQGCAQDAVEPVFSIQDPYSFQGVSLAYRNGFADPAFLNATMCAISFAQCGSTFTPEVLHYQGQSIRYINQQLRKAVSLELTLGAILLLIGIEWRAGSSQTAKIHLRGIAQILKHCELKKIALPDSVRRGIFWQDLNTAIVSSTDRVLSRSTFPEFKWGTGTFAVPCSTLPAGFKEMLTDLSDVAQELQDLHVLQARSLAIAASSNDVASIYDMDNQQACVEARLHDRLQELKQNGLVTAILLAAYLYCYNLFNGIWNGFSISLRISTQLLHQLQELNLEWAWVHREAVLMWCSIIGGCLSPPGAIRTGFGALLRQRPHTLSSCPRISWANVELILTTFLWQPEKFRLRAHAFWDEEVMLQRPEQ